MRLPFRLLSILLGGIAGLLVIEALLRTLAWSGGLELRNRWHGERVLNLPPAFEGKLHNSVTQNLKEHFLMEADDSTLYRVHGPAKGERSGCYTGISPQGFRAAGEEFPSGGVVLLGDSCFFGVGICAFEDTLGPRLENALARLGTPLRVVNLAQPGFSSEQAKRLAATWLPRLRPSWVVVGTGWNDLWPSTYLSDRELFAALEERRRRLRVFAFLSDLFFPPRLTAVPGKRRVPEFESLENARAIATLAAKAGARTLFVPLVQAPKVPDWLPDPKPYNEALRRELPRGAYLADEALVRTRLSQASFRDDGYHFREQGITMEAEWLAKSLAVRGSP